MEMILTGTPTTAAEMERFGVVNRTLPLDDDVLNEALEVATTAAQFSAPAIGLAKQAVKAGKSSLDSQFGRRRTHIIQVRLQR
jgi:enoyl-CoA hydratase